MDTSATALMHDIGAILDDFKMEIMEEADAEGIVTIYHLNHKAPEERSCLLLGMEEKVDSLKKEINGLFNSSYSFNK